ncbi:unnamed protein product [Dibothriocephalus latus]|uniref:Uncharacterized protein n=1 Tax=Dibothriocephalus latus TaxID=60516 RepID=A0A3P7LEK0_DIBLA|nr:unnamed protein product [Dibothriocephalus latus]
MDPISADLMLYRKKYSELVQYQTEARSDGDLKEAIEQAEVQLLSKQNTLSGTESSLKTIQRQIESKEGKRSGLLVKKTQVEVEIKTSTEAEEKQAQTAVDEARAALVRVEQSISTTEKALKDNANESAGVKRKLDRAATFSAELEKVNQKLKEATEAREALEDSSDAGDKEALDSLTAKRTEAEASIARLDAKIGELQRSAMVSHERDLLQKNRQSKVEAVRKL